MTVVVLMTLWKMGIEVKLLIVLNQIYFPLFITKVADALNGMSGSYFH